MKILALALVLGSLASCNWTSQLDRDAGACLVLAKNGGSCTVTIPAPAVVATP